MFDFGRFVARGGQIHSAGGRLHGVASSVSTGGATDFFFPVVFELESASRSEDTHSAARLRWQSATIRIERTERRKNM